MNRVVKILMHRDDLTESEVHAAIDECRELMLANTDCADEILMDLLDLEPDYLPDVLFS